MLIVVSKLLCRNTRRGFAALLILSLGWSAQASAQIPAIEFSTLQRVPLKLVQAPLAKSIELASGKSRPFQFAVKVPLRVALAEGLWDQLDAGTSRWRMRVGSPGAESLNFEFSRFHLPPGAALWIYDTQGALVQGPYTSANETPEGKLWTAVVLGEQAVLEVRAPDGVRNQVDLELGSVGHGFRGFGKASSSDPGSGSCNVDVVCPAGDPWRSEIRSVARIQIGMQFLCTGQMLNNTRQDNDPLFVTANHCEVGQTQSTPASSVVFYWNYFNSQCREASGSVNRVGDDSPSQNTQTGSSLLAGDANSDFTLVRLAQAPPSSFKVYFAGWNASNNTPHSGVAIHHPHGYEKSISVFSQDAQRRDTCIEEDAMRNCLRNVSGWDVRWSQGTTEQGSSGGGLWDQDHRVVGWLSAGSAGCGPPADDGSPDGDDIFGRMELAWDSKSADDRQLKHWLDPGATGALSVCGKEQSGGDCSNTNPATDSNRGGGALSGSLLLPLALLAARRRRARG